MEDATRTEITTLHHTMGRDRCCQVVKRAHPFCCLACYNCVTDNAKLPNMAQWHNEGGCLGFLAHFYPPCPLTVFNVLIRLVSWPYRPLRAVKVCCQSSALLSTLLSDRNF